MLDKRVNTCLLHRASNKIIIVIALMGHGLVHLENLELAAA